MLHFPHAPSQLLSFAIMRRQSLDKQLGRVVLHVGDRLLDLGRPRFDAGRERSNLRHVQHARLHVGHLHASVNLVKRLEKGSSA